MTERVLDGILFRNMIVAAKGYLASRKKEVDSLNVFPVPDGDTGTNMYLTLSSAADRVANSEGSSLSEAAEQASHGALMGARGNSGVILSQIFRGISRYFAGKESVGALDISNALDEAVSTAYKAVMRPVEGTILTVLRGLRDGAKEVTHAGAGVSDVLQSGLGKAKEVLASTPELLPVLKQAGVVDAGGKGLVYVIEGALTAFSGSPAVYAEESSVQSAARGEGLETFNIENPYDTQFLISGKDMPLSEIRSNLERMGDSLLVVGSGELARIHIHTKRPGDVLNLCQEYGALSQVVVDNMIEQAREAAEVKFLKTAVSGGTPTSLDGGAPFLLPRKESASPEPKETGIVSVATGEGLRDIMKSLGCDLVIEGGMTMNPSTAELAAAVKTVNAKRIIFLPNNGNIFLAAKQAKKLTGRNMYIVPSKTIPQGISALLSLNLGEDMEHNLKRASKAIKRVKTGEITYAARDGKFGRHAMKKGDILGLIDGKVELVGSNPEQVLLSIVKSMVREKDEIVTLYYGKDVSLEAAEAAVQSLRGFLGENVEVELQAGGQPLYYYIISVE